MPSETYHTSESYVLLVSLYHVIRGSNRESLHLIRGLNRIAFDLTIHSSSSICGTSGKKSPLMAGN